MGFFSTTQAPRDSRSIQYLQEVKHQSYFEKMISYPLHKCKFYKIFHRNRGLFDIILMISFCITMYRMNGKDLSSTLTVSAMFEFFSYVPLMYSNSLSPWTSKMLIIVLTLRSGILYTYRGTQPYLPTDQSGKIMFPLIKFCSLIGCIITFYRSSRRTLRSECPYGENIITILLCAITGFIGYFFFADLIEYPTGDRIFAAITMIETIAYIPQLRRILNYDYSSDDVPWIICSFLSQCCSFFFWYLAFEELQSYMHYQRITGPLFIFCWLSQLCMSCAMIVLHYVNMWWKRYGHTLYVEKGKQQKYMSMSTVI